MHIVEQQFRLEFICKTKNKKIDNIFHFLKKCKNYFIKNKTQKKNLVKKWIGSNSMPDQIMRYLTRKINLANQNCEWYYSLFDYSRLEVF